MKKLDNVCFIPPSLSWTKKQLDLYFSLAKRKDIKFAYHWTDENCLPILHHSNWLDGEELKKWEKRWKSEPGKKQIAARLPKGEKFDKSYACSKYALHASEDPLYWAMNYDGKDKLWVVAMVNPISAGDAFYKDIKFISQRRIVVGLVPKNEFVERAALCAKNSHSFRRQKFEKIN